jgi:hypothetical protein
MASRKRARVDPELQRQLRGKALSARVDAVFRLRPTARSQPVPSAEQTRAIAERVVARVARDLALDAGGYDFNVFPNLGYFVVSAPTGFIERLLEAPEIASASANRV